MVEGGLGLGSARLAVGACCTCRIVCFPAARTVTRCLWPKLRAQPCSCTSALTDCLFAACTGEGGGCPEGEGSSAGAADAAAAGSSRRAKVAQPQLHGFKHLLNSAVWDGQVNSKEGIGWRAGGFRWVGTDGVTLVDFLAPIYKGGVVG